MDLTMGEGWYTDCIITNESVSESPAYPSEQGGAKMRSAKHLWKLGEVATASGQYQEIGPRGGKGHEVTVVKGERLPPTRKSARAYKLVDRSKNKSGQS